MWTYLLFLLHRCMVDRPTQNKSYNIRDENQSLECLQATHYSF